MNNKHLTYKYTLVSLIFFVIFFEQMHFNLVEITLILSACKEI